MARPAAPAIKALPLAPPPHQVNDHVPRPKTTQSAVPPRENAASEQGGCTHQCCVEARRRLPETGAVSPTTCHPTHPTWPSVDSSTRGACKGQTVRTRHGSGSGAAAVRASKHSSCGAAPSPSTVAAALPLPQAQSHPVGHRRLIYQRRSLWGMRGEQWSAQLELQSVRRTPRHARFRPCGSTGEPQDASSNAAHSHSCLTTKSGSPASALHKAGAASDRLVQQAQHPPTRHAGGPWPNAMRWLRRLSPEVTSNRSARRRWPGQRLFSLQDTGWWVRRVFIAGG